MKLEKPKEEKVPEEEIKAEPEIEKLKRENELLRAKLNELTSYIEEIKKREPRKEGITLDPNIVGSVIQGLASYFNRPKTSEIEMLLSSAETLNRLKEYMRNPIEEELIKNSLDLQRAALETQKTNMEIQKMMLRGMMKQLGVEPEKPKSITFKIPPEAFEHE